MNNIDITYSCVRRFIGKLLEEKSWVTLELVLMEIKDTKGLFTYETEPISILKSSGRGKRREEALELHANMEVGYLFG